MRQVIPPGSQAGRPGFVQPTSPNVRAVRLVALVGVLVLLTVLERATDGRLGVTGWVVGLTCGGVLGQLLTTGMRRASRRRLTPADRVTLTRAVLACGVAALVAQDLVPGGSSAEPGAAVGVLVALASVALALDAVDGRVARRTGTVHPLGARFDMEADAFLILALSVHVAAALGWWVLGIGAARYVLLVLALASRWAPWLRGQVPARLWRKAVAAYQGIALTAAASAVLDPPTATVAVAVGLALLVVSFGTEALTLRRLAGPVTPSPAAVVRAPDLQRPPVEVSGAS